MAAVGDGAAVGTVGSVVSARPTGRVVWAVGIALAWLAAGCCMFFGGIGEWIQCVGFGLLAAGVAFLTLRDYKRIKARRR